MGQSLVHNSKDYSCYTYRIQFLRTVGDHLLQQIQILESDMNKRKQQNQQPLSNDIIKLHDLTTQLLFSLAEINVCQYFYLADEFYNFNDNYYKEMCRKYFQDLMHQFNSKLKEKRIIQIKHNLYNNVDDVNNNNDDDDNDIDFSIA